MKLSYRGIQYNQEPTVVDVHAGRVAGKYRGANWQAHELDRVPAKQSHPRLMTYRGVSYS